MTKKSIDVPDLKQNTPKNKKVNKMKSKELQKKRNEISNKQILRMSYLFAGLFLALMIYIGKYVAVDSKEIITSPYNRRQDMFAESVIRGQIVSSNNKVLAKSTVKKDGSIKRDYPYDKMFAHIVGFADRGKSGIESSENFNLLTSHSNFFERMYCTLTEEKMTGDNVITTLDTRLQKAAYDALGNYKGSVVVLEPSTGKILAMVSKPDFNPNNIDSMWSSITSGDNGDNSVLLNRATQGLYPPGSTFKMLTALQYIKENPDYKKFHYKCTGKTVVNGVTIRCYNNKVHGDVDLAGAFAVSCNTAFANIGKGLNKDQFHELCETFLFNQDLPIELASNKSSFVLDSKSDSGETPQTVIGQGKTTVTPLHMAMMTASVANGGVVMTPYYVDRIENYEGELVEKYTGKSYANTITTKEASILTELMEGVVKKGTATALSGYQAAGKTGSAEFETGKAAHAWFTGFAPSDNPEIVVTVIVENVGTGSSYAVPVAKRVFESYFANK